MTSDSPSSSGSSTRSPKPGYAALRQHRWSAEGAEYFVTIKAQRPADRLAESPVHDAIRHHFAKLAAHRIWQIRTWVIMPDHLHLLFTLGPTKPLADCIRLFKGGLTPTLRKHNLRWQDGYYEHRMRSDEDRLPVFLYLFLNPHRTGLLPRSARWPAYFCCDEDWAWFAPLTDSAIPYPAWLA